MRKGSSEDDQSTRKRGRPTGKNRVPLTLEERRARNTQYERERRNEKSRAMAELAVAAGCESSISATDLLATVIHKIQDAANRKSSDDIENLRRINENLMSQISKLENELKQNCPEFESNSAEEKDPVTESESEQQPSKSVGSAKQSTCRRQRKTVSKRKRKHQHEERDTSDSAEFSSGDNEVYNAKRIKTDIELDTQFDDSYSISSRRVTRSTTSQSSYETRSSQRDYQNNEEKNFFETEFDGQSNSTHEKSEVCSENSTSRGCTVNDPMLACQHACMPARTQLPSMFSSRSWAADYYTATPELSTTTISNEITDDLILPLDLDFFDEGDLNLIADNCELLGNFFHDNSGNNFIFS